MDTKHQPFMYRVHEQPSDEKIERLNNLLGAFGLFVHQSETGDIKPMDVQQVLEKVKGKPEERIISTVALRSMQQARYSDMSLGTSAWPRATTRTSPRQSAAIRTSSCTACCARRCDGSIPQSARRSCA